jgi:hypothetical protein
MREFKSKLDEETASGVARACKEYYVVVTRAESAEFVSGPRRIRH